MNKHFEDARYYLGRAAEHAAEGLREELSPVEERFRTLTGNESAPEPSRLERIQGELKTLEERASGESRKAISNARERIQQYRESEAAETEDGAGAGAESESESEGEGETATSSE
jgi:phage terminase small subunit